MNLVGLLELRKGMQAYLRAIGDTGTVVTAVGWRQRPQQVNQGAGGANRIVLYPGLEPGGKAGNGGTLTRNHRPSTDNPRALITWMKTVTMSVWACDTSNTYDEELQIAAVENLLELAVQAVHNAADPNSGIPLGVANVEWGAVRYTNPPVEMRFGQEVLVEFVYKCPLFDQTIGKAFPQGAITKSVVASIP